MRTRTSPGRGSSISIPSTMSRARPDCVQTLRHNPSHVRGAQTLPGPVEHRSPMLESLPPPGPALPRNPSDTVELLPVVGGALLGGGGRSNPPLGLPRQPREIFTALRIDPPMH